MILDYFVQSSNYLVETRNKKYLVKTIKSQSKSDEHKKKGNGKTAAKKVKNKKKSKVAEKEKGNDYSDDYHNTKYSQHKTKFDGDLMNMLSDKFRNKVMKADNESKLSTFYYWRISALSVASL